MSIPVLWLDQLQPCTKPVEILRNNRGKYDANQSISIVFSASRRRNFALKIVTARGKHRETQLKREPNDMKKSNDYQHIKKSQSIYGTHR